MHVACEQAIEGRGGCRGNECSSRSDAWERGRNFATTKWENLPFLWDDGVVKLDDWFPKSKTKR